MSINFGPVCTSCAKVRLHCFTAVQTRLESKGKAIPEQTYYTGVDKSLASPGNKQANVTVRMA